MIDQTQATPCVCVVSSGRQRKLPKGTEVEVRAVKDGNYGLYALAFVEGQDRPVFLGLQHLDFVSDVSAERQAEIDAEKAAWLADRDAPVVIGRGERHPGGKAIVVGLLVDLEATDQGAIRHAFFPLSQVTETDGIYSAPPWLARIKAQDAAYYWLSHGGRKGIDHLGGAGIAAHYQDGPTYPISVGDLREAAARR